MAAPSGHTLKIPNVHSLAFEPSGNLLVNGSANRHGWGLRRIEVATRKVVELTDGNFGGPFAMLEPNLVLAVEAGDPNAQVVALDRSNGSVVRRFGKSAERVIGIAVSADQKWVAVLAGSGSSSAWTLSLFDAASGKHTDDIEDVQAFAFSEDGASLSWVGRSMLRKRAVKGGKVKELPFDTQWPGDGVLLRQGKYLLSPTRRLLIDDETAKTTSLDGRHVVWANKPGTVLCAGLDGRIDTVDLKGKVLSTFYRPRKIDADSAASSDVGWYAASTGKLLELYDLGGGKANALPKAPSPKRTVSPRQKVVSNASGDVAVERVLEAYWKNPDDVAALKVYADRLSELDDPRGEFITLRLLEDPTDEQRARIDALLKLGGKLVGPAREFLRTFSFGRTGLVDTAVTEAEKLVAGFELLATLSPRLTLNVTSLRKKTKATIAELAKLDLGRIYFLRLEDNALTDASVEALAPALKTARNLSLANNDFGPAGLRALGRSCTELEFLCLGFHGVSDVLTSEPGFRKLKAVMFYRCGTPAPAEVAALKKKLPKLELVHVSEYPPYGADAIDAFKRGED